MAVGNPNRAKAERGIVRWIDDRFPLTQMWQDHMSKYYASKTLTFGMFWCSFFTRFSESDTHRYMAHYVL